jgi:hypothetical protein
MTDDPERYEAELGRVGGGSGVRWLAVWAGGAALVVALAVGGALLAPAPSKPAVADVAPAASPAWRPSPVPSPAAAKPRAAATLPPLDITSGASGYSAAFEARRREGVLLVVESTDFHANSGPAYYGIGGRLIRALETAPAPGEDPAGAASPAP